jgi:hypothetical protein
VKDHRSLLARLLAAYLVLFGSAALNAAGAEEVSPDTTMNGKSERGLGDVAAPTGSDKATSDQKATKNMDSPGGTKEQNFGSKNGLGSGEKADSAAPQHGDDRSVVKHGGMESNPIDTRITILGKPRTARALSTLDWKKTKSAKPSGLFSDHRRTLSRAAKNDDVRNAIGQLIHPTRVDIGAAVKKRLDASSAEATPKSGAAENSSVGVNGPGPRRQGFVPLPAPNGRLHDPALNTAMNHSIINGTGMGHPAWRTGAVGGPTKNLSGVLSGTDFHPRHP